MLVYDPYDWKIHEDPYPVYRALRDEAPAYFNPERKFWALSRHQDVLEGFRDPVTYSNEQGVSIDEVGDASQVMSFLGMDPPEHGRIRTLVSRGFTPRRVGELESGIRELATHYIDSFIESGSCEFIDCFAGKLPMDVISQMLGVPAEDRDALRAWADLVLHREEGSQAVPPEGRAAAAQLIGYFAKHVDERRERPGDDDLTDALIRAELEGDRLANRDIIAFLFLMVIAGNETTTKLLANALYWIERNTSQSLAFGQGTHFCLGASLARLEARVSLEEIHRRIGNFEIQADGLVRVHSSNVRGFAKMPVAFPTGVREGAGR